MPMIWRRAQRFAVAALVVLVTLLPGTSPAPTQNPVRQPPSESAAACSKDTAVLGSWSAPGLPTWQYLLQLRVTRAATVSRSMKTLQFRVSSQTCRQGTAWCSPCVHCHASSMPATTRRSQAHPMHPPCSHCSQLPLLHCRQRRAVLLSAAELPAAGPGRALSECQ